MSRRIGYVFRFLLVVAGRASGGNLQGCPRKTFPHYQSYIPLTLTTGKPYTRPAKPWRVWVWGAKPYSILRTCEPDSARLRTRFCAKPYLLLRIGRTGICGDNIGLSTVLSTENALLWQSWSVFPCQRTRFCVESDHRGGCSRFGKACAYLFLRDSVMRRHVRVYPNLRARAQGRFRRPHTLAVCRRASTRFGRIR